MNKTAWLEKIAAKGSDKDAIANRFLAGREDMTALLDGLDAKAAGVKFGCAKVLRIISEKKPEALYPYFDRLTSFLESDNAILRWGAIIILSNLAAVDSAQRFARLFRGYYGVIAGPDMIAAANVMAASPKIARAHPRMAERIKNEILKVERATYKTAECRNVALGHAIDALAAFYDLIRERDTVLAFVRRQLGNPRRAVALRAARFLKRAAAGGLFLPSGAKPATALR
jgi:hypothetical protein